MRASTVGLPDDQIRLATVIVQSDDVYPLATTRVKRITNDHIIAMTMGSVLRVRLAGAKVILGAPSDTR
jgi:hypothetical protein